MVANAVGLAMNAIEQFDQCYGFDLEASLLAHFAHHGFGEHLADLDEATGNGPSSAGGFGAALDEQDAALFHDDRAYADERRGWKFTPRPPRTHLAATLFTVLTMTGILAGGGASTQAQSRKEGAKPSPIKNLFWQPDQLKQGSPVQFTIELEGMAVRVSGAWLGKPVTFFRSEKPHVWMALAGADVATEPGNHNLIVVARMR